MATDEVADKVLEKVENILKEACPSLSCNVTDRAHRIASNHKCLPIIPVILAAASLYVSTVSSIEHRFLGTGMNLKVYGSSWI